jgi:phosphatidylglycerophosphatase A
VGYFPLAPGTAGSAVGLVLVAGLSRLPLGQPWPWALLGGLALVIFIIGVWAASDAEKFFGRTDPPYVVIDEVVGQMLTFLVRPDSSWKWLLAGFVLFRIFDVVKPFPARRAERLAGGWGIMMDDVAAGAYSMVALLLLGYLLK